MHVRRLWGSTYQDNGLTSGMERTAMVELSPLMLLLSTGLLGVGL